MSRRLSFQMLVVASTIFAAAISMNAQTPLPAGFQYQWESVGPDTCIGIFQGETWGYQEGGWNFATYNQEVALSGRYDFYQVSWTLTDSSSQLAAGSYDSRTGKSTGGTGPTGANFSISRVAVGDLTFLSNVSYYSTAAGCGDTYQEVANAHQDDEEIAITGGHVYSLESVETGFALTMPNNSLGTQLIQSPYTGATNQQWTFNPWSSPGEYYALNVATGESLYYDGTYNGSIKNPPVVQSTPGAYPACSSSAWRFVSVGDGTFYIIGVSIMTPQPPPYSQCAATFFTSTFYTMTVESTGSGTGIEASSFAGSTSQRWKVIVVK